MEYVENLDGDGIIPIANRFKLNNGIFSISASYRNTDC